jgi:hypothetical protein
LASYQDFWSTFFKFRSFRLMSFISAPIWGLLPYHYKGLVLDHLISVPFSDMRTVNQIERLSQTRRCQSFFIWWHGCQPFLLFGLNILDILISASLNMWLRVQCRLLSKITNKCRSPWRKLTIFDPNPLLEMIKNLTFLTWNILSVEPSNSFWKL